jgi:hypothetical protein
MIAVSGTDVQGASIPIRGCTCTVSRLAHPPLQLFSSAADLEAVDELAALTDMQSRT